MRKTLAAGMAAITFGGAVAAAALPTAAEARDWRGGYGYRGDWNRDWDRDWDRHRHRNNDAAAAAVVAGIAGLVIGSALADSNRHAYNRGYYNYGYNGYGGYNGYSGYGYAPSYYGYGYRPYAMCESRRWVYDPYIGRKVMITSRYAC